MSMVVSNTFALPFCVVTIFRIIPRKNAGRYRDIISV